MCRCVCAFHLPDFGAAGSKCCSKLFDYVKIALKLWTVGQGKGFEVERRVKEGENGRGWANEKGSKCLSS